MKKYIVFYINSYGRDSHKIVFATSEQHAFYVFRKKFGGYMVTDIAEIK